jgi:hypothetical protein
MSVRPSEWNNSAPTEHIFVKFYIEEILLKFVANIEIWLKMKKKIYQELYMKT